VVLKGNSGGKTVTLKMGATAWEQAQAAQKAFGMTVICGRVEETGDHYTVQVFRPSVFPIIFVKGSERVRSWVDSTKTKVIQEEARRLFGGRPSIEMLEEPGLVYAVKASAVKKVAKRKPESNTRQMTGAGINNNNNTFTWCGPSGVLDCTGQRPVGPAAGGCKSRRRLSRCAIQPADSGVERKPPRRKKITT
jgi:hypothetical protein